MSDITNLMIQYLQDAEAAEQHFEDALATFGKEGDQPVIRQGLEQMSAKAKTQHERLRGRLEQLGSERSTAKSFLAHAIGMPPAIAQIGHSATEKNTQHLIITVAAAAAEIGMYEALQTVATLAGDATTASLARELQNEEREDYRFASSLLDEASRLSLSNLSVDEKVEAVTRYLEDAIAAEKLFETQLRDFAEEATLPAARDNFLLHADETRLQYSDLTYRLELLGSKPSLAKSFFAHLFGALPKAAQIGHAAEERTTQNLIMAFSVENCELAFYECLIAAAESAGDAATAQLARRIQAQEKATAEKIWSMISVAAEQTVLRLGTAASRAAAGS